MRTFFAIIGYGAIFAFTAAAITVNHETHRALGWSAAQLASTTSTVQVRQLVAFAVRR